MTARSLFGHFRPELSIQTLLGKVVRQGLENGTEAFKYCTSDAHEKSMLRHMLLHLIRVCARRCT